MEKVMTDSEAYRILTREWTLMHHTERTALDQHEDYRAALDAVIAGDKQKAISLVIPLRTIAGAVWRSKQGVSFRNVPRLAPHGGCNWSDCEECFPPKR